ncbi:hypothetical protein LHYA1_G002639 [Lachnellula hyalina]|uniref:Yeast cell wall synthesis Kre9/Knh1-like N-terminal domain-containing protein n=1 Tax=Lachnellula hyalina TaxID=1316788 RepID=A0A8H8R5E4_9HELO|nr:uncharacterized protein LHYA1_G002639 [Lachnellula hyalina]TVY28040.1 hypothetical protein LHYA1_G002639 [Lachnellula hyalina]
MRFTQTIFALAAFTSAVLATDPTPGFDAISSPSTKDQNLVAGSDFTITWTASSYTSDSDTVSIVILAGNDPATLQPGDTITSIKNSVGSYTWKVPSSTAVTYGFKIQLNSDPTIFQYSQPFHITGGSASSSSSSSVSSVSSASAIASAIPSAIPSTVSSAVSSAIPSPCSSTIVSIVTVTASAGLTTPEVKLASATISNSSATAASNTTLVAPTTSAIANTSTTLLKSTIGATKTGASSSSSATAPIVVANAAASNLAQGGIALIGGLVLAFAL